MRSDAMPSDRGRTAPTVALLLLFTLLAWPTPGWGYTRSQSDLGVQLWWSEDQFTFVQDERGCVDLGGADGASFDIIRASFSTWDAVECPYGHFRMDLRDGGVVAGRASGFELGGANENLMIFIQDAQTWAEAGYSSEAIAMTLVTHDRSSGKIYDADIEFNDAGFEFAEVTWNPALPLGNDRTQDLENATTHEIGHILGLDHSFNPAATMYGQADPAETKKRDLTQDDIDGLCSIWPPQQAAITHSDFSLVSVLDQVDGSTGILSCRVADQSRSAGEALEGGMLLALLALLVGSRKS